MPPHDIVFNRPYVHGTEAAHIAEALKSGWLSANGRYAKLGEAWLERETGAAKAILTHTCSAALEMAIVLAGIEPGDEVIMPSFTFVATATAVALRGGIPVFVDIRPDTLNIDPDAVSAAVTSRTKAVFVVHYAGVAAEMDRIGEIAARHGLIVIEDAAHGIGATWRGRPLGTLGALGAYSFHETKNINSGEGGCLLINDPAFVPRAEIVADKGTDRAQFERGEVAKYVWRDIGASYRMGELPAAFLWGQLEASETIQGRRQAIWQRYHAAFASGEAAGLWRRPTVPQECGINGHIYYLMMPSPADRGRMLDHLRGEGVLAVFHYVPLHDSPAGLKYGRTSGTLAVTEDASARLLRLPLYAGLTKGDVDRVIAAVAAWRPA